MDLKTRLRGIRIWLAVNDTTQKAIARKLGISNPYLTMILRGQRPAVHIREQLVDLGVPADLVELPGAQEKRAA